jgi:hypothetical protein
VTGPLEQYECNFAATMAKQQGDVGRYPAYDQRARGESSDAGHTIAPLHDAKGRCANAYELIVPAV